MTAADGTQILLAVGGLISASGHVAVLVIRELRRRPETIPPPTPAAKAPAAAPQLAPFPGPNPKGTP